MHDLTAPGSVACRLSVCDLRIWVSLGCSIEEQANPQLVAVDLHVDFTTPPQGLLTDSLDDTVCYRQLADRVKALCDPTQRSFHLIEHMAWVIHQALAQSLKERPETIANLTVNVHKVAPPLPDVYGGTHFTYSAPVPR